MLSRSCLHNTRAGTCPGLSFNTTSLFILAAGPTSTFPSTYSRPCLSSCQPGQFALHGRLRCGTPIYNECSRDWLSERWFCWDQNGQQTKPETDTRLLTMLGAHGQKPDNRTQHKDAASRALALYARQSPSPSPSSSLTTISGNRASPGHGQGGRRGHRHASLRLAMRLSSEARRYSTRTTFSQPSWSSARQRAFLRFQNVSTAQIQAPSRSNCCHPGSRSPRLKAKQNPSTRGDLVVFCRRC